MKNADIKSLDHIVLPVPSLDIARKRLTKLGFNVAPDGHHPFGTENSCVFFQDNTYLEPLAIGDEETYNREVEKGNGFLGRDQLYRQRNGDDGFSLIALTTSDAAADRQAQMELGYDCGQMVSFRRDVKQRDGSIRQISINLFITATDQAPDLALFSCQWLSEKVFDPQHMVHANGALGIKNIALAGADSGALRNYLTSVAGKSESGDNRALALQNANILLMSPDELNQTYGMQAAALPTGLGAVAIDVYVTDLKPVKMVFFATGIEAHEIGPRLIVPPAEGQGFTIAFIEEDG